MEKGHSHCSACGDNFARKFKFCPNCGSPVTFVHADFGVTIVGEENGRQRNLLLLGAAFFLTTTLVGATIFSIFNKELNIDELGGDDLVSYVSPIDPLPADPLEEKEKSRDAGDEAGGGGSNDSAPAQKGASATQVDNPLFAPSKSYDKVTDPDLAIRAAITGKNKVPPSDMPYGLTRGADTDSDGQGCCGGQGDTPFGRRGQGNEPGSGLNSGNGKPGGGVEDPEKDDPAPTVKTGVTTALVILSKPRANYTDKGREKFVQGKVVLRVTFLANGQIGPIATMAGLPEGLTEQAIAAARMIKFQPAKVGGTPIQTTRVIEYSFAIF